MNREQLNTIAYQQAVTFAENFAKEEKHEFLNEMADRRAFEQAHLHLQNPSLNRPLARWVVLLACVLIVSLSSLFYWQTGRYSLIKQGMESFADFQKQRAEESSSQRNTHYIVNLQEQLRANPNNGSLWLELGQAYALNNEFEEALICYQNAEKVLGKKASIWGAMATADYYLNKQRLSERASAWIEQALNLDPKESASLLLKASDAFLHHRYQEAIDYWESALESDNQALDRRAIIQSIQMAEQFIQ